MPEIASDLKAGSAPHPLALLVRMVLAPARYLGDENIALPQLAGMLAWIIRGYGAVKLIGLYPWRSDWLDSAAVLMAVAAAPVLAKAFLAAGAPLLDGLVRPFSRRKDRMAAARSLVCAAALPNPFTALYFLCPLIAKAAGNPIAGYLFFGSCSLAGALLDGLAIGEAYRLPRLRRAVLGAAVSLPAALLIFQVPFYLSDRFSPRIVREPYDASVLALRPLPLDRSVEGAAWMVAAQGAAPGFDTAEVAQAGCDSVVPTGGFAARLDSAYAAQAGMLRITWFDKSRLPQALPEAGLPPDSAAIRPDLTIGMGRRCDALVLRFKACLAARRWADAAETLEGTLSFLQGYANSNLGLVAAVVQAVYVHRFAEVLSRPPGSDPPPRWSRIYAASLERHPIHPEAILNAFRLHYLQSLGLVSVTEKSMLSGMQAKADSFGLWLPAYGWRKFYDGEEEREIVRAIWARALSAAYDIRPGDPEPGPEERRLQAYRGRLSLLLFRNTLGRIMAGVAAPLYQNYARTVRDDRREAEAVRAALLFRAARAESGRTPGLDGLPKGLEFAGTFSLAGDSLISAEPARSTARFAIALGKTAP